MCQSKTVETRHHIENLSQHVENVVLQTTDLIIDLHISENKSFSVVLYSVVYLKSPKRRTGERRSNPVYSLFF